MANLFAEYPIVLSPAATGPAPLGLQSTGDPRMNAPWTALGVPAISVPMPVDGAPIGLQMTAAAGHDAELLALAVEVERALC
jgi:Asp-tRNA(Asn)/Glu-tRNA(Gln) amidotransferase A subunit family amidase